MSFWQKHGEQPYDITPVGLDPWSPRQSLNGKSYIEYMRGLEAIDRLFPTILHSGDETDDEDKDKFAELRYTSLMANLAQQCDRNNAFSRTKPIVSLTAEDDLLKKALLRQISPAESIQLHNREPELIAIEYARLSHAPGDWAGVDYIDEQVEANLMDSNDLDTQKVESTQDTKLKQFNDAGQIIQIKPVVYTHINGSSVSKHRFQVAVDLRDSSGVDSDLKQAIYDTRSAHWNMMDELATPEERSANEPKLYEDYRPEIGRLILPYLAEVKKPKWLQPHLTSYYVTLPKNRTND